MAENEQRRNNADDPALSEAAPDDMATTPAGDDPVSDEDQFAVSQTEDQSADSVGDSTSRRPETMMQAMKEMASDDDETPGSQTHVTLASILGGDILGGRWFRKQVWYMLMLTAMLIVYVSNRYACQQEMIQTKMLSDTLLDRRYKAITRTSQLKEHARRSYIEETLADSSLQTAVTPSYKLNVNE